MYVYLAHDSGDWDIWWAEFGDSVSSSMAEGIHVTEKVHCQDSNTLRKAEPLWPNHLITALLLSTVKIIIK